MPSREGPMRCLSASDVLEVWERGHGRSQVERALLILAAACETQTVETLASLPIGRRDALLLETRRRTFGDALACWMQCPACREQVEFAASAQALAAEGRSDGEPDHFEAHVGDAVVTVRLPTSHDLLAVRGSADVAAARRALVERCVVRVVRQGLEGAAGDLDDAAIGALSALVSERDQGGETLLALRCPGCGASWQAELDVGSFLWEEIAARAGRVLREVHVLAGAYGWAEADILALSAARRYAYGEMIAEA